jgi:hypothetical protein
MASASHGLARAAGSQTLLASVGAQGSAAHPWPSAPALLAGPEAARNLSDLIHFLCILHGRYPGVIDHAAARGADAEGRLWLAAAAEAFAAERAYISRLAAAAGPLPSTPGAADSDAAVIGQRHAIEMLACSERQGCALGAAMAVVLDWRVVRGALDAAALRFGVEVPAFQGPDEAATEAEAARVAAGAPAARRALMFGAEQILVQHYGLWELLETRARARST